MKPDQPLDTRVLQKLLNASRVRGTPLKVDGIEGPLTISAVREFQGAHRLQADGVVGPETRAALLRTAFESSVGSHVGGLLATVAIAALSFWLAFGPLQFLHGWRWGVLAIGLYTSGRAVKNLFLAMPPRTSDGSPPKTER